MDEKYNEEEDEIKILGSGRLSLQDIEHDREILDNGAVLEKKTLAKKRPYRIMIISLICLSFVLACVAAYLFYIGYLRKPLMMDVSRSTEQIIDATVKYKPTGKGGVTMETVTINSVRFKLYTLKNLTMSIEEKYPDDSDSSIYFVTRAMDYRKDNNSIIGQHVINGNLYGRSRDRVAYLASVPGGLPQIGIGNDDDIVDHIVDSNGNMVRQFALVSSGQICTSQFVLKGKVTREAFAWTISEPSTLYFLETLTDESMYDFAEAIVDMGFTDAIYITSGLWPSRFYRAEDKKVMDTSSYPDKDIDHQFLVFRGK